MASAATRASPQAIILRRDAAFPSPRAEIKFITKLRNPVLDMRVLPPMISVWRTSQGYGRDL